jgi:rubredoxin
VPDRHGKLRTVLNKVGLAVNDNNYRAWMCIICGWVYEEEKGAPEEGLAPGTRWEDVPEYWVCPDCGAGKDDFEMIEI